MWPRNVKKEAVLTRIGLLRQGRRRIIINPLFLRRNYLLKHVTVAKREKMKRQEIRCKQLFGGPWGKEKILELATGRTGSRGVENSLEEAVDCRKDRLQTFRPHLYRAIGYITGTIMYLEKIIFTELLTGVLGPFPDTSIIRRISSVCVCVFMCIHTVQHTSVAGLQWSSG